MIQRVALMLLFLSSPLIAVSQEALWKSFTTSDGLPSRYINSIFQDRDGAMWFATDKGVARFDGATFTTFNREDGLPEDFVVFIAQDSNGAMYFKTFEKGWAKLEANQIYPLTEKEAPSLHIKPRGGFYNKQLNRLTKPNAKGDTTHFRCVDGGEAFIVNCTFEDKEGTLWVGTFGQGVKKMRSERVTQYTKASGLPSSQTNALFKDSQGRIWIGTTEGVACLDKSSLFTLPTSTNDNEKINTVGFAQHGDTLLVAGLHYMFQIQMDLKNKERLYKQSPPRVEGGISAIRYSTKGFSNKKTNALWIATYGSGVHCIEEDKPKTFLLTDGLASDMIETIDEGVASIWFSSRNSGVSKFQDGKFQTFTTKEGLPSNVVFAVLEEVNQKGDTTLWICTSKGLLRRNQSGKKILTTQDGLSHESVRYAFRQASGELWVVTRSGLCRLESEEEKNVRFVSVGSIPIRPKSESSASNFWYDGEEDKLWITTSDGALSITLRDFAPQTRAPVARLSKVVIDTLQVLSPTSLPELAHWQNTITFTFTSDSYREPENAKFRFRLKGSDKTWSITSEPNVVYCNLPDGKYEMEVFAITADGVESKTPARLASVIAPPFWKSKWAYLLYALMLMGIVLAVRWVAQNWNIILENRKRRYIGHYELKQLLGEGGMGKVYQAIDLRAKQVVAIKVLHAELLNDGENRRRLANEGQLLRDFHHPNIIKVFEVGESQEQGYLVMEYLSGGTLKAYLNIHHPLALGKIQQFALQICDGLSEIHRRGIVHRDLKTMNLMLDEKEQVKIMDFGLSKSPLVSMKTTLGTIIGTLGYVAPEQITGTGIDARTDIFSFGVVLYELCTNQLPFAGENEMAVIHAIFNRTPTPICDLRPDLPKAIEHIVKQCLHLDLNARYQTIDDVRSDLENLVSKKDASFV